MSRAARSAIRFLPAACLTAVALTGCGGEVLTHHVAQERQTARSYYTYASANQSTVLEVHGLSGPAAEALAAAMPAPSDLPPTRFVTAPAAAAHPEYRVVLVLSAPSGMGGADACALTAGTMAGEGRRAEAGDGIQAAYCYRERVLSQVRVGHLEDSLRAALAAGEPGLTSVRGSLARIIWALLPPDDDGLSCFMTHAC